jgi:branched-chain amino acid transport system permease protein
MAAETAAIRTIGTALGAGPSLATIGLAALAAFPLIIQDSYFIHVGVLALMHATLATSWNLLCGYGGIFSMGHQAFFGLGAYTSALLAMRVGVSPWAGMLIGGAAASGLSLLVALPTLRLRAAPYVAIATLGFAEACRIVVQNLVELTRGEMGLNGIPGLPSIRALGLQLDFYSRTTFYYLMLVIFGGSLWVAYRIVRAPFGMALKAIRESQDAAEALGVNHARSKILIFAISSGMAGLVGAFYAHYIQVLTPSSVLSLPMMVEVVAMTLIGGLGTILGPIIGSVALSFGLEYLRFLGDYRMLLYGLALVPVIVFMPQGVVRRFLPRRLSL